MSIVPPLVAGAWWWPLPPQASQPVEQQALEQQALVQQLLLHFFLQPPNKAFSRPPFFLQHFDSQQDEQQLDSQHFDSQQQLGSQHFDSQQQLGSQQLLSQQFEAAQQLGSQQPLLPQFEAAQQLGSQQPLSQQFEAAQQLGSHESQQLLLHFFLQNMPFKPPNRSHFFLQHFCSQQQLDSQQLEAAQQLGSQQFEAAQQLGSQQFEAAQQLGSQQFEAAQQLGSQQLLQWLASIMRLSSSKAMPWLHMPMLTISAPNIFHFIAQRLLSMEPGSDASPTNTGDGRAGIS